jgi:hypothetical protein
LRLLLLLLPLLLRNISHITHILAANTTPGGCSPQAVNCEALSCMKASQLYNSYLVVCCYLHAADGTISMAHNGNAFGSLAMLKQKIILHGGVFTAMAKLPTFELYPGNPPKSLYDEEVPANELVELHAVFCYGFADSATTPGAGYWLCKNR